MKISVTVKTTAAIMISAVVLLMIGGMLRQQSELELSSSELVNETEKNIAQLDSMYASLIDLENAEHAYVLDSSPAMRQRYDVAVNHIVGFMENTRALSMTMTGRRQEAQDLADKVVDRVKIGKELVDYNPNSPDFKSKELKYLQATNKLSDNIRRFIDDLKRYENELLFGNQQQLKEVTVNNILGVNTLLVFISGMLMSIWVFVVRYVSERQQAETNLRQAEAKTKAGEARTRAIVETAPDGIITIAEGGEVESANAAMEKIFGYKTEELIGQNVSVIIKEFFSSIADDCFRKRLQTGDSEIVGKDLELVGLRKDGTSIPIELAISVLNLGDRQILNAVVRDITERKEVEKRVSEFYSTVSHELRTPLTSIRTALGLMESGSVGKLPGKAGQLIRIARSECDRLIRLINDILDIRKIEAGKLVLKIQTVQPEALIDITFNSLRSIARESGIRLVSDIATTSELRCDIDRIVQVLTNFVSNAIRFSPKAGSVMVRAERTDHGAFRFAVIDSGPGIPPDQVDKLWDRFQQLDSAEGKAKGGSGLGLAITKAIVTQHAGHVGVESAIGEGSKFWFELPEQAMVETEPAEAGSDQDRRRILLIDDDDEVQDLLNGLLSTGTYELLRASTITEANRLMGERRPDVVLLDIQLPDGNGFDLISTFVLDADQPTLPFVVLPGREPTLHTLGNPVLIDWLIKPPDDETLRRSLTMAVRTSALENAKALVVAESRSVYDYLTGKLVEFNVECLDAREGVGYKQLIRSQCPDLIVLDIEVGQQVCFDIFQILRQEKLRPIPLVVYANKLLQRQDLDKLTLAFSRYLSKSHMSEPEFLGALRDLLDGRLRTRKREAVLNR